MKSIKGICLLIALLMGFSIFAVEVTFKVDMAQQTVPAEGVHIAGSFQGWDPGATMMSLESGSVYMYTATFEAGEMIEYKFVNGDEWGEDESVPAACNQNNNRFLVVPDTDVILEAVCFGSCAPCGNPAEVTFQVDMSEQTVAAEGVHIAGNFQGWNAGSTELLPIGEGVYAVTFTVSENDYLEFKYINGNDWPGEEAVPPACGVPDGVAGFNRFYTVPVGGGTLPVVCFASCNPCGFVPEEVDITFRIDMMDEIVSPDGIHLTGSFQDWDLTANEMTDIGNSIYETTITLWSGDYHQYKFINGITWEDSEIVPADCGHDDGNGGYNRFITVPAENLQMGDFCFSSCDPCSVGTGENFESINDAGFTIISPNPFDNTLSIQYFLADNANVKISILNIYGQVLAETRMEKLASGEYHYTPKIRNLSKGIYFCRLEASSDGQVFTELKKIIKQ